MAEQLAAGAGAVELVAAEAVRELKTEDWAERLLSATPTFTAPALSATQDPAEEEAPWFTAPMPSLSLPEQRAMLEYLSSSSPGAVVEYLQGGAPLAHPSAPTDNCP